MTRSQVATSVAAKKYIQHNQPKKIWIKPPHKSVNNLLTQPILPSNMRCSMQYKIPFPHECLDELRQLILGLPDFRTAAGKRHQLATLLLLLETERYYHAIT